MLIRTRSSFLCADMFKYEDSKIVYVCPSVRTPRKEITVTFCNISPTVVIDTSMERFIQLQHGDSKIRFSSKNAYLRS